MERKPRTATAVDHRTRVGQERSLRTEARILSAALRVFADKGPDAPVIDDFVQAAGIARGTFYNHFQSVEELREAASVWTTGNLVESIEAAIAGLEGPALRFGVGVRLFLDRARRDPVWCRFVARVWKLGSLHLPTGDLEEGLRLGIFRIPSIEAARDLVLGGLREVLLRLGSGDAPPDHGDRVVEMLLQTLGTERRRIAAVMSHELPALPPAADAKPG